MTAISKAQLRMLFDSKGATWSAKYAPSERLTGRLAQLVLAVHTQAGTRMLDLGCGTGDLAPPLPAANRRVTGSDTSMEILDPAPQEAMLTDTLLDSMAVTVRAAGWGSDA